ncbi:MAG: aldo/keto reductase [Desulfobacterales bacterium]|jgi:predicted aldo/keto reductase-like oxidoreductase
MDKNSNWTRRYFLKAAWTGGAASMLTLKHKPALAVGEAVTVPTRPFGKTGVAVPILGFGTSLHVAFGQLLLKQAVKWGVTYWDTAHTYMGGNSEEAIGKYFEKYPADRKKVFLVTKSHAWNADGRTRDLHESLERMQTDYVDLYFAHGVGDGAELDAQMQRWAQKAKAEGNIRYFGFSTHRNVEQCMLTAAGLGWIDGIMMRYNFRLMQSDQMKRAVAACARAGIGLTAMKTQGGGQVKTDTATELKLAGLFLKKGFTDAQAKLKAVWQNPLIASICSEMPNMSQLMSNVAAAVDKISLSARDMQLLKEYARETRSDYCAGCADICESATPTRVPIADVMRYLMYARSYGNHRRAGTLIKKIPAKIRAQMLSLDYGLAEQRCPRKIAIGNLVKTAIKELS